jgi:serine/threonine protein kinase
MHSHGYVHRDVKLENILIHSETMDAKISDLGFAEPIHSH